MHETLGTGTFGRVRLVRHKGNDKYFALKVLKKQEVVRLKQLEHVMNEKKILAQVPKHPQLRTLDPPLPSLPTGEFHPSLPAREEPLLANSFPGLAPGECPATFCAA
jgi:serine/threonine protein kinase